MIGGKILNRYHPKMHKPGGAMPLNGHRYSVPSKVTRHKHCTKGMDKYQQAIILALAKRYSGEELEEKLVELTFCSI